jgi:16S rRNA (cytidine1402-2'-O)-methyltransferase
LGENNLAIITDEVKAIVQQLDFFVVENLRTARRYLRAIGFTKNFDTEVSMYEMAKHGSNAWSAVLAPVLAGKSCGVISEAGCPCIADPGNSLVSYSHKKNIEIVPLVGPNSILLALIGSGFSGQQFTFHGYLPVPTPDRIKAIKKLENEAIRTGYTQLFMETPFRNNPLFNELIRTLQPTTLLSVGCDLTLPTQYVKTKTCKEWEAEKVDFHKRYCVFSIGK